MILFMQAIKITYRFIIYIKIITSYPTFFIFKNVYTMYKNIYIYIYSYEQVYIAINKNIHMIYKAYI